MFISVYMLEIARSLILLNLFTIADIFKMSVSICLCSWLKVFIFVFKSLYYEVLIEGCLEFAYIRAWFSFFIYYAALFHAFYNFWLCYLNIYTYFSWALSFSSKPLRVYSSYFDLDYATTDYNISSLSYFFGVLLSTLEWTIFSCLTFSRLFSN